jgi:hypothetical protein
MERQGLKQMRPSGFEPLTYRLEGTKESPEPRRETDEITVFYRLKRCIDLQYQTAPYGRKWVVLGTKWVEMGSR